MREGGPAPAEDRRADDEGLSARHTSGSREPRGLCGPLRLRNITNAAVRLLELLSRPEEAQLLSPLIIDEILIRLLRSPLGSRVAQIGLKNSGLNGVSKSVAWLRSNFTQPVKMESLARLANMSASTFHSHFKAVTAMSPLQFQKVLRLQEASDA